MKKNTYTNFVSYYDFENDKTELFLTEKTKSGLHESEESDFDVFKEDKYPTRKMKIGKVKYV